jgi:epoxyqueuosine reductase
MPIVAKLSEQIKAKGFEHFGFTKLDRPLNLALYRKWIDDGCHGDMEWLAEHLPAKENPKLLMAQARSAIVVTQSYYPAQQTALKSLRTALYAQSPDYHDSLMKRLRSLKQALEFAFPDEEFLCYTDALPVAERELAARAGLGWLGKNGCLIDRKQGSLFVLGGLLTSLDLEEGSRLPDFCGSCDRCITSCPTSAIRNDRTLDARLCISYWNIEAKESAPEALRSKMNDWFFGCDICQTVCPWNEKVFGKEVMQTLSTKTKTENAIADLRWCLTAGNIELEKVLKGTPLLRARSRGLRRNALYIVGNLKLKELRPEVERISERFPRLRETALWTLGQLMLS